MPQLDAIANVRTAQEIVAIAEAKANYPGKHLNASGDEALDAPAYRELQSILDQLALTQTFTFTRSALDFYITGRNNTLPSNFWRVGFSDPCWIVNVDGTQRNRFFLLDAQDFHTRFQDGATGTPQYGYINRNTGDLTVDPAPDREFILELHFYPWQPTLESVEARPWFPFTQYLVHSLLCEIYLSQDDTRMQVSQMERARLMKEIKGSLGDDRDRASNTLQLDPIWYRNPVEL